MQDIVKKGARENLDINKNVSENLKRIREEKGLSLDKTAKLTGVSKSMLGQIERGEVNPTISVLWKIANGLKVSFTSLVERHEEGVLLIRSQQIEPLVEDEGKYINYPVFTFEEKRSFETYRIEIKEGGFLQGEPHLSGCEEYVTVFSGEAEIGIEDEIYHLNQWDSLQFKADVPHSYRNVGKETVYLSMMIYYAK